jgi:hypothetical protein
MQDNTQSWLEEDRPGCGIIVWLRTDRTTDAGYEAILALIDGNKVVLVWIGCNGFRWSMSVRDQDRL